MSRKIDKSSETLLYFGHGGRCLGKHFAFELNSSCVGLTEQYLDTLTHSLSSFDGNV